MNVVPKDVITELKAIPKNFTWRGRKPKTKHSTLIGNYVDGGLKDFNKEMKFKSLKLFWIKGWQVTAVIHEKQLQIVC